MVFKVSVDTIRLYLEFLLGRKFDHFYCFHSQSMMSFWGRTEHSKFNTTFFVGREMKFVWVADLELRNS